MSRAIYRNDNDHIDFRAARDYKVGELVVKHGLVGITCGEDAIETGEQITLRFNARVELTKTSSALVIAEDAVVGYTIATQTAVAEDAGDFNVGIAVKGGSAAGDSTVQVLLNVGI